MHDPIVDYLKEHPAQQLLWIGREDASDLDLPGTHVTALPLASDIQSGLGDTHYDCAVLQNLPGPLDKAAAESLVARLRDVQAQRILWWLGEDSPWSRGELLALGFRLLDGDEHGERLYGYDIDNYKQTPDWLNARHWANPELWGKYRW